MLNPQASNFRPSAPFRSTCQTFSLQQGTAQTRKGNAILGTIFVQPGVAHDPRAGSNDILTGFNALGTGETRRREQVNSYLGDEDRYDTRRRGEQETRPTIIRRVVEDREEREPNYRFEAARAPRNTYNNRNEAIVEHERDPYMERERQRYPNVELPRYREGPWEDRQQVRQRTIRKSVPVNQWRLTFSGDGKGLHLYDFL